jgi:hypothetical protein
LFSPRSACIGDERMDGYGLLRRFDLARTNDTVNDRSSYAHRSLAEVDVAPLQAEQLALSQAGGYCQENQRSFSDAEVVDQSLDFSGRQDSWCSASLCTLTDELNWIAVKQLVSAGMIEKHGHQISSLAQLLFAKGKRRSQLSTCIVLTSASS